jgi:hypothetical protein
METGVRFLKNQIDNAVAQHDMFLRSLIDHESQAQDQRFRDLCTRHIPRMQQHQRMLEELQHQVGAAAAGGATDALTETVKRLAGSALGIAKDLADAPRQSDYYRLVGDIVLARQGEDTFKTFREGGRALSIRRLADIGDMGERHHDDYVKEANRLVQQLFVEQARGAEDVLPASVTQPENPAPSQ